MRPNTNNNNRRARGRGGRKSGNSRNQTYDSNGPGARVRGNPSQIYEKYQQLARDAGSAGDRVGAENYLQHAEHYYRLMADAAAKNEQRSGSEEGSRDEGSRNEGSRNESPRDSANGHGSFVDNMQTDDAADASSDGDDSDDAPQSEKAEKADGSGSRSNGRKRRSRRSNGRTAAADGNAESDGNAADDAASASDDGDSGDSGDSGDDDGEAVTA